MFLFSEFGFVNSFFWVFYFFYFFLGFLFFLLFFGFFILCLLWWLVTLSRTRARFGSLAIIARNNFYFYYYFTFPATMLRPPVLLLLRRRPPVLLLLRLVLMSSCVLPCVLLLRPAKCISDFSVRYVCLFIQEATHVYWVIGLYVGVHLPFFWVEYGLQICAMCDI